MKITGIKTPIIKPKIPLLEQLSSSLPKSISEKSIIVFASKVVSIAEGRLTGRVGDKKKLKQLVKSEAEFYLDSSVSRYDIMLTIKRNWMFVNAGIDQSNSAGQFCLWPLNPQKSANKLWFGLHDMFPEVKKIGVIITDSGGIPLNWGVVGRGIAHCGFKALRSYVGDADLYGRTMEMEKANLLQSISAAATLEMGEGAECKPVALVTGVPGLQFQYSEPTEAELKLLRISKEDDAYEPLLNSVSWKKGGGQLSF